MPDSWDFTKQRPDRVARGAHQPILTWLVFGLCVLLTVANHTSANRPGTLWYQIGQFGVLPATSIWSGHYGALLTSVFIHGNPRNHVLTVVHLGFNMLWFVRLGIILEETLNPLFYALFFIASAVVGAGAELAFAGQTGIGASGVVYAMIGLMWVGRRRYPKWRAIATGENLGCFVTWGLFCLFTTWMNILRVANAAHIAGFVFGLAVGGLLIGARWRVPSGAVLLALAALTAASVTWLPWSEDWTLWKADQEAARGHYDAAIYWYRHSIRLGTNPYWAGNMIADLEMRRSNPAGAESAMRDVERTQEPAAPGRAHDGTR